MRDIQYAAAAVVDGGLRFTGSSAFADDDVRV